MRRLTSGRGRAAARRALRLLAPAILILLGVAMALVAVPRLLGYPSMIVAGGSMGEAYPLGSVVVAGWVPSAEVREGDVVVTVPRDTQVPVLHRIVEVGFDETGRTLVWTKGDANESADAVPQLLPERVLSPKYHVPYLGFGIAVAMTPPGWLLLVLIPGAGLSLRFLFDIWSRGERATPPTPRPRAGFGRGALKGQRGSDSLPQLAV